MVSTHSSQVRSGASRRYPPYPAAHSWPELGFPEVAQPHINPTPSQSALASTILPRKPGLSGTVFSSNPRGHLGALVPSGDKSHTWQRQLDPQGTSDRQGAVSCLFFCIILIQVYKVGIISIL